MAVVLSWDLSAGAEDGRRISCFVMGDVVYAPYNPFTGLFMQDPTFRYSLYPLAHVSDREKRKLDRVYYPRTFDQLTESYDFMVFRDARVSHFSPRQFRDLELAFREAGMGSVTVHSLSWDDVWVPTILYDLSPISEYKFRFSESWYVRLRRDREPVFLPFIDLGIEKARGWEFGIMEVKQGATVWGDMYPRGDAWLASWRPGGKAAGMQWVFADKFDVTWWGTAPGARNTNPYAIDFATNLILYSLDWDLISDIHSRREARMMLSTFRAQKLLVVSMLDWAELFGGNILSLSDRLKQLEEDVEGAVDYYLEQDYASAMSVMDSTSTEVSEITADAIRLKDQALFWVYLIEWLAVTAAFLVSGVLVWTLMIRRWKYREVGGTRVTGSRVD